MEIEPGRCMDPLVDAGRSAIAAGNLVTAQASFDEALLLQPRNAWLLEARDAVARCARVLSATPTETMSLYDEPRFIVIGVQKCGTTALYGYLCQHPQVLTAIRKETHFFDWNWSAVCSHDLRPAQRAQLRAVATAGRGLSRATMGALDASTIMGGGSGGGAAALPPPPPSPRDDDDAAAAAAPASALHRARDPLELRSKYLLMFPTAAMRASPSVALVSGEATPSYFLYGELVARRIKAVCPHARLVIAVRNPIARAYSHYQMTRDTRGSEFVKKIRGCAVLGERSFEEAIDDDVRQLQAAGVPLSLLGQQQKGEGVEDAAAAAAAAAWSAAESPTWLDAAQARYFDARPNGHGAHSYVGRGLYALQLRLWLRHFPAEQIHVVDIDEMRDAVACVENMRRTFAFLGLPPHAIPDTAPKNTKEQRGRTYGPMDPTTHRRLDALFAPHNAELQRLAGVGGSW